MSVYILLSVFSSLFSQHFELQDRHDDDDDDDDDDVYRCDSSCTG